MSTDPMVVTWFGEATAAGLHAWGGRVGALIVVCAGLWIVRTRRPWNSEEVWTFFALLVWIAADMMIVQNFGPDESAKIWTARLFVFLVLASEYVVLRARHSEVIEETLEVEELVVEPERERDKA